jgi:hypothetical protein
VQLLASLVLGLPLRLLGRGDLLLDVDCGAAHDLAIQPRHRGVNDLGALLGDLSEERGPRRLDLLRDLAEDRFGRIDLVDVEQRSEEHSVRPAEQHAERTADDPDEEAYEPAARGADNGILAYLALLLDAAGRVTRDDRGAGDLDLVLRIELLEVGERLVGVLVVRRVLAERDDEDVVRREIVGLHVTGLS